MSRVKKEILLCTVAIVLVLLNVVAHLLGGKMFVELPLAEVTVALTPLVMIFLGVVGLKVAGEQ
ncbi:hypothetical protein KP803_00090 [Vibrio sp. ZSDE26]|uniref:Uncharacterized protein n=1 Tax=Vibrio amylolyticus TaxID=2847292 RepID=A0A9X2BGA6_9VIBR|nr:hypothetical protein [Vibrio amylolyticus]MCK6261665.1 hypothetical protein [Vibrio amylolyticus]